MKLACFSSGLFRRRALVVALPIFFICACEAEAGQTEAEEFEAIFGEAAPASAQTLFVPFILDRRPAGDVRVTIIPAHEEVEIIDESLLEQLEVRILTKVVEELRAAMAESEKLRLSDLRSLGLEAVFDWQRLELRVDIPPELRQGTTIHLSRRQPPPGAERAVEPGSLSAFLNFRAGLDHVQQSATGNGEGFQPFRADFDGAINLHDWVLEGSASFTEGVQYPLRRGNLRLIRDDQNRRTRYTFGDLIYPTTGFQQFSPMAGVTVARNFALQPYRVTEPRGQSSFFLRAPSTVEVLVNGRPVRTLQLSSGSHTLQDFNFAAGGNDVELRITDDVGRMETIGLSFFFDARLLAAGEHEFSYSAGVPSQPRDWGPEYDADRPAFSIFHRIGLTDRFSAGLNLQGDEGHQMFGAESLWATPFGTFQPDMAMSFIEGNETGYTARMGYRYYQASSYRGSTWNLSVQYRSPTFAAFTGLADSMTRNPVSWNFAARYSQRLPFRLHGGIGGTYQMRREAPETMWGANLFLSRRVGQSGVVDLTLERRETPGGVVDHRAFFSFTYSFPARRQRIRTTYDSMSRTSRADWSYTSRHPVGGVDANLGVQHRPDGYSVYGGARYTGYRAEASLFHDVTTSVSSDMQMESRSRLRFGTALVYADGHFAISRPVRDSFAIITAHPDLRDQEIGVDPLRGRDSAKIDRWGPAVIPDLNSHLVRNVAINAPELPLGYHLGPGAYSLLPTYKSGTVIRVGTGATVLLAGMLETPEGEPASLQFGEVVSLIDPDEPPVEFFTNRSGKFHVEGFRPGSYEMRVFSDPPSSVQFIIPEGRAGIYDIGALRLRGTVPEDDIGRRNR